MASGGNSSKPDMTHDEIWDDSALIESWNDALAEYKKYHSIHLKGAKTQELLAAHARAEDGGSGANEGTEGEDGEVDDADEDEGEVGEDGEMDESGAEAAPSMPPLSSSEAVERPAATRTPVVGRRGDASEQAPPNASAPGPASLPSGETGGGGGSGLPMAPPQVVLGSVRDEGLKKLLMSWYYAGYYTGLYEGQQQQQQ